MGQSVVKPLHSFPAFYGIQRFITALIRALHMSLLLRSGEYDGWVMSEMFFLAKNCWQEAMCCSFRYRDAETAVPGCHLSHRFLRNALILMVF
jgi:hypothetical protein